MCSARNSMLGIYVPGNFARFLLIAGLSLFSPYAARTIAAQENEQPERLIDKVLPEGKEVDFEDFKKAAGEDFARTLLPFGPKTLRRDGDIITLSTDGKTISTPNADIKIAKLVSCRFQRTGDRLTMSDIKGITVTLAATGTTVTVKEAVMSPVVSANGKTGEIEIEASVELAKWLPLITFKSTIDPDKLKQAAPVTPAKSP